MNSTISLVNESDAQIVADVTFVRYIERGSDYPFTLYR